MCMKEINDGYDNGLLSSYDYRSIHNRINYNKYGKARTFVDTIDNMYLNFLYEERIFNTVYEFFKKNSKTPVSYKRLEGDKFHIYIVNMEHRRDNPFESDYKIFNYNSIDLPMEIKRFYDKHEFKLHNIESYVDNKYYVFLKNVSSEKYYMYSPLALKKILDWAREDDRIIDYKNQKYILIADDLKKNNGKISFSIDQLKCNDYIREYDTNKQVFITNTLIKK